MEDPGGVQGGEATLVSVNVGRPRSVEWRGRSVTTAIWKAPVAGAVAIRGVNLLGDDQADRRVHGGPDKAVYAYAVEDYEWWAATAGPLGPGTFGENLTTRGIALGDCAIGDRWHVGGAVLEVAQPREPCFKLGIRMGDDGFPERFEVAIGAAGVVVVGRDRDFADRQAGEGRFAQRDLFAPCHH